MVETPKGGGMAETTYTVKVDCHRCGETTTMAGVRPTPIVGGGDLVNIAVHCDHCGAAGGYAVERRCLIGQPDYLANVDMAHGWSAAQIRVAPETTFGTASPIGEPSAQPIDLTAGPFTAPLRPGIETHIRSSASMPPAPADEWSKPVKGDEDTWRVTLDNGYSEGSIVIFSDGEITAEREATGDDGGTVYAPVHAPRDVVLCLLAAEASDRLGWVWDIANFGGVLGWIAQGSADDEPRFRWIRGDREHEPVADRTTVFRPLPANSPDELLAAQHGYFLLADAIREAGQ